MLAVEVEVEHPIMLEVLDREAVVLARLVVLEEMAEQI
jgi:hypothetical protein